MKTIYNTQHQCRCYNIDTTLHTGSSHRTDAYDRHVKQSKPLLAGAKVGWRVCFSNNESRTIKEIITHPSLPKRYVMNEPILKQLDGVGSSGTSAFNENGTAYTHFCGTSPEFDIYATHAYEPKPVAKPRFEVGQYVKWCKKLHVVEKLLENERCDIVSVPKNSVTIDCSQSDIVYVPAKDVVLDFGNGIKGMIKGLANNKLIGIDEPIHGSRVAVLWVSSLTEPMQSTVLALLKQIEKEES
jgi:hypothetical protein